MTLKVLTYNLHKGYSVFNLKYNLFDIKEALKSTDADIVFLQEETRWAFISNYKKGGFISFPV